MALTTKYFVTTVATTLNATPRSGFNISGSGSSGATSTLYIVPSGRNAKVKLIYASLSVLGFGNVASAFNGYSGFAAGSVSAFLNIAGSANFSTGATYSTYYNMQNIGGSIGWSAYSLFGGTGNFAANANTPLSLSNYYGFYASGYVAGFANGLNTPPPGFLLINSGSTSSSFAGSLGSLIGKTFSFVPQNFFLTSGQSIDITASVAYSAYISYGTIYGSTYSAIASVAVLVIEEAAN